MGYLIYKPSKKELKKLSYWYEVWRGLPDLSFETTLSTSLLGQGWLKYDKDGNYVLVMPSGEKAYKRDPNTIFMVIVEKSPSNKIKAPLVMLTNGSLEEVIKDAVFRNYLVKELANEQKSKNN